MRYRSAVNEMLINGKIPLKSGVFVDAYNHKARMLATITCRVDSNNYYVTTLE